MRFNPDVTESTPFPADQRATITVSGINPSDMLYTWITILLISQVTESGNTGRTASRTSFIVTSVYWTIVIKRRKIGIRDSTKKYAA